MFHQTIKTDEPSQIPIKYMHAISTVVIESRQRYSKKIHTALSKTKPGQKEGEPGPERLGNTQDELCLWVKSSVGRRAWTGAIPPRLAASYSG